MAILLLLRGEVTGFDPDDESMQRGSRNCQLPTSIWGRSLPTEKQVLTVEPSEWWGRRDPKPRSAGPRAFRVVCFHRSPPGTCAQAPWLKVGPQPCRSHEHIRTYQLCRVGEGSIFRRNTFLELSPAQGKKPRDATPASQGDRGHVQIEGTPAIDSWLELLSSSVWWLVARFMCCRMLKHTGQTGGSSQVRVFGNFGSHLKVETNQWTQM